MAARQAKAPRCEGEGVAAKALLLEGGRVAALLEDWDAPPPARLPRNATLSTRSRMAATAAVATAAVVVAMVVAAQILLRPSLARQQVATLHVTTQTIPAAARATVMRATPCRC